MHDTSIFEGNTGVGPLNPVLTGNGQEDTRTASDVAREAMEGAGWNMDKALSLAMAISEHDFHLTQEVLRVGWQSLLMGVSSSQRERHVRAAKQSVDSGARIRQVARDSMLDTWLVGSTPLGACTADDLRRDIALRKANATTETKRAAFMAAVLKKLKPGKRVGDCWNETDIKRLAGEML